MIAEPLVSVIMPYYNLPDYFREALLSLEKQTYQNFEVIVVDDASPDFPAEDVLCEFSFPRQKLIRHETNKCVQTARNTGVTNSSGSLILPFDCDDMLDPAYLATTVQALENPELAGVYTQIATFGELSEIWTPQPTMLGVMSGARSGPNTFLYRRNVYDSAGGYNTRVYCSDAALWLAALAQGFKFELIPLPLMRYRVRSEGRLAKLHKPEHVPQLAAEFPDLYKKHMLDLLRYQEERFFELVAHCKDLKHLYQAALQREQDTAHV
jgi:glycosyltransferase involved in cell wall biosynthesis